MRILVTGSRTWTDKDAVRNALLDTWMFAGRPYGVTVVHGGARGADYLADVYAKRLGFVTEAHRAPWESAGRSAGYLRNKTMVDLGADICLAFIKNNSKGATMCADLAEKAGIPVHYWRE